MQPLDPRCEAALRAGTRWLQRVGAEENAVALVTVAPRASVGIWIPGHPEAGRLGYIDDIGAELCEDVAPAVEAALEQLNASQRDAALRSAASGRRLQLLLLPTAGELSLRLVGGGQIVALVSLVRGDMH